MDNLLNYNRTSTSVDLSVLTSESQQGQNQSAQQGGQGGGLMDLASQFMGQGGGGGCKWPHS